jgi:hypothetical protein
MQQKLEIAAQNEAEKRFPIFNVHLNQDVLEAARFNQSRFIEGARWGAVWEEKQEKYKATLLIATVIIASIFIISSILVLKIHC